MQNHILEANLNCLRAYNPELAQKLVDISALENVIQLTQSEKDEPNLTYNLTPIHSQQGAVDEAEKVFKSISGDSLNHTHILFGMGLGFLFKTFYDETKGSIILYEPSLEILRIALELIDYTKELSDERVRIVHEYSDLRAAYEKFYSWGNKSTFSFLDFHKKFFFEKLLDVKKNLEDFANFNYNNYELEKKTAYEFLNATLNNFDKSVSLRPLSKLKDKFKKMPAVIVSAGPSLHKNIDILRKYQDNAIIFCVGTAYKTLAKNGIKADFLNILERYDCSSQIEGCDLSEINMIVESYTHPRFYAAKAKRKFLSLSVENTANKWLGGIIGDNPRQYETKGTVSYNALASAKLLGCDPIILIGQDLAYSDGYCYAKGSAYENLQCVKNAQTNKYEVIVTNKEAYLAQVFDKNHANVSNEDAKERFLAWKLKELNEKMAFVKGQDSLGQEGEMIPTEPSYALFVSAFEAFAHKYNKEIRLINSSIGGAYIDGYEYLSLEKAIKGLKIDKSSIEKTIKKIDSSDVDNSSTILKKLQTEIKSVENVMSLLESGQTYLRNLSRELGRRKSFSSDAKKQLENCLGLYLKIQNENVIDNYLLSAVFKNEFMQLDSVLKVQDADLTYNSVKNLAGLLESYFYKPHVKLQSVICKLKQSEHSKEVSGLAPCLS